jgi:transcriptional regulator with XRE-family HTH domain
VDERAELLSSVGNELVSKRAQLGWSLEEAAASARVDPERLAAAEEGNAPLESDELDRVAGAYGVNATYFFGGRTTPLQYLFGA